MSTPSSVLTAEQMQSWTNNGYLVLPGIFADKDLQGWANEMQSWPETAGKWMKYFEYHEDKRLLCRVENFLQYHEGWNSILKNPLLLGALRELFGEEPVIYKEKLNFKLPGSGAFLPHQDAPAFTTFNQKFHITMMISIDYTTKENGCLEFVNDMNIQQCLPQGDGGAIHPKISEKLQWTHLLTKPGDVVLFNSYVPHRSMLNRSDKPRRVVYVTYNAKSAGSFREQYYEDKRRSFPPEIEQDPTKDYSAGAAVYNVGNPINEEKKKGAVPKVPKAKL